jgi:hypothetical protein
MRGAMRPDRRHISPLQLAAITAAATFLAFAVRYYWLVRVQSPLTAVYSDMGGYVTRAERLLGIPYHGDPRTLAFYPWGAHALFALEFFAVGRYSAMGIAWVHAVMGALTVTATTLLAAKVTPRPLPVTVVGFAAALWQPQIQSIAFFMSEMWFSLALLLASWLFVRTAERRSNGFVAGCCTAIAFVVRPQVLLTCGLLGIAFLPFIAVFFRRAPSVLSGVRALVRAHGRTAFMFGLPLAIALVGSAIRLHHLSGHYGLISENGPVMKLFADTDVGKIESTWVGPQGQRWTAWYSPGTKAPVRPEHVASFQGYIGDPEILERIRKDRLRGVSVKRRLRRMWHNVTFLAWNAPMNPEGDFVRQPMRGFLQDLYYRATLVLIPLGLIGTMGLLSRRAGPTRVAGLVVAVQLASVVIVAALYFAEPRYRVPYDPFLLIAAVAGLGTIASGGMRVYRRFRRSA